MFLRGIGHEGILLLLYQEMPRIGILVSQYIEVSWLDEYIDVVNRCRLGRIECFEIFISQDDGRGYVLTGRFSLFILQDYIVGDGNGEPHTVHGLASATAERKSILMERDAGCDRHDLERVRRRGSIVDREAQIGAERRDHDAREERKEERDCRQRDGTRTHEERFAAGVDSGEQAGEQEGRRHRVKPAARRSQCYGGHFAPRRENAISNKA